MATQRTKSEHQGSEVNTSRPFMTTDEAAEWLGVSKATLYGWLSKKKIPYYKPTGRKVWIAIEDLNNFVLNRKARVKSNREIEEEAAENYNGKRSAGRS